VIDLEQEIEQLKMRLNKKDKKVEIRMEDLDRLKYIQGEIKGILPE